MNNIRDEFPILQRKVREKPLVYLDNAATTQKPRCVLEAISRYYAEDNANIHRGVHYLSERATRAYEGSRARVKTFINAGDTREIIFTRGTTEAINLVANAYGRKHLGPGDTVLVTGLEHHSNIVPWQMICEETGARLEVVPITDAGEVPLDAFEARLTGKTKIAALTHMSNALGTINPVQEMVAAAHRLDIPVVVDGAQAIAHLKVDVRDLDCDFYAFSAHKVYGPTGIGVLYGKRHLLEAMPPYQGGGDMIASVTFEKTTYNAIPHKFEAGTPNISGAIGLDTALDFVERIGHDALLAHEEDLLAYAVERVSAVPGVRLIGTASRRGSILSFVLDGVHPHDIGTLLDLEGIALRVGHHCAQPVMERFGIPATARASFAVYNTRDEVDALVRGIQKVREAFRR